MNEIYWLTRLDAIHGTSVVLFGLSLIFSVVFLTTFLYMCYDDCNWDKDIVMTKKVLKYSVPITIIMGLSVLFVPTTKEAYLIYGVGGTLDYLKSNEKVQKLPDKVVDAIDRYLTIELSDSVKQNNK